MIVQTPKSKSSMRIWLIVSAFIEVGAGLSLLCSPSATVLLLIGATLEEQGVLVVDRVAGAGLLALGVACWMARDDSRSRAARGVIIAMLIYDVVVSLVLAFGGISLKLSGMALWPAVVLHTGMTAWCVALLWRSLASASGQST